MGTERACLTRPTLHKANEGAAREAGTATVQLVSSKIGNTGMFHHKAYCEEIFGVVHRAFQRRGFEWSIQPNTPADNEGGRVQSKAIILLGDRRVGFFVLGYRRHSRKKRMANGTERNTHHPVHHSLHLEVTGHEPGDDGGIEISGKSSSFLRGMPGVPGKYMTHSNGDIRGGRPKVRRWATYAAKALLVHHVNKQAEFIHDQ